MFFAGGGKVHNNYLCCVWYKLNIARVNTHARKLSFRIIIIIMRGFGSALALSLLSVALQIELQPVWEGGGLDLRLVCKLLALHIG